MRRIFPIGNTCTICEETYPSSILYTCQYCKRRCCGNCIIQKDNGEIICLECAVKSLLPQSRGRSRYANLSILLAKRFRLRDEATLSFAEIEDVIGDRLPKSAYENRGWWNNVWGHPQSEAWLTVGWRVKEVNLEAKTVTFIREEKTKIGESEGARRRRSRNTKSSANLRALATKAKLALKRSRKPSKTKIALLQARLKNIERSKGAGRRGGKSVYERRLYRAYERP
ncbi:MAG: hypothetical protein QXV71_05005 [Candidatus Bathyarchaeia archaeon]